MDGRLAPEKCKTTNSFNSKSEMDYLLNYEDVKCNKTIFQNCISGLKKK